MNTEKNSLENYSPGRFIFKQNPDDGSVGIVAIAEKFADALETANIELLCLERKKEQEPGRYLYRYKLLRASTM